MFRGVSAENTGCYETAAQRDDRVTGDLSGEQTQKAPEMGSNGGHLCLLTGK
jgi:hypothetical protein